MSESGIDHIADIIFQFDPLTARRYNSPGKESPSTGVYLVLVDDTGRTLKLTNNNAFGTVYNKRTGLCHKGKLTHIYILFSYIDYAFGPWVGLVAGGVGAALADVVGGYAQWAPLTFLAHGLEGLVAGALARRKGLPGLIVAWLAGALVMITIYFVGEFWVYGMGPAAWAEVPVNLLQNVVGGAVGIPLYYAVRKAYPPIVRLAQGAEWQEAE